MGEDTPDRREYAGFSRATAQDFLFNRCRLRRDDSRSALVHEPPVVAGCGKQRNRTSDFTRSKGGRPGTERFHSRSLRALRQNTGQRAAGLDKDPDSCGLAFFWRKSELRMDSRRGEKVRSPLAYNVDRIRAALVGWYE